MSRAIVLWLLLLTTGDLYSQMAPHAHGSSTLGGLSLNLTVTSNASCAYNNGIIVATASGGTPPYSYSSSKLGVTNNSGVFANVPPGNYDVEVTDATGQVATSSVPISNSFIPPFISGQSTDPTGCAKTDGFITLTPIQGQGPFEYSIDDGQTWQKSNVFGNLGTGFYNIWVMDADGCVSAPWSFLGESYLDYQFYNIKPHYQVLLIPTCGLQLSAVPSGPVCGNNGTITFFAASGGTPPYTYSLDGITFAPNTVHGYTGLAPGPYTVYAMDATGLVITIALDIPRSCPVTANATASACGQTNGSITVTGADGIAPYTYSIDGVHFQPGTLFTGLAPGGYTIIAKDAHGATSSVDVDVQAGCPFVTVAAANATCGLPNGSITVIAGGAPGPFQYSLDGIIFQPSNTFMGLAPGPYAVTVDNGGGLVGTAGATIGDDELTVDAGADTTICEGAAAPLRAISNGVSFSWSPTAGLSDAAVLQPLASPQTTTQYTITALNGLCSRTGSVTVFVNPAPVADPGPDTLICSGQSVRLQGSGGVGYQWSPATFLDNAGIADPTVVRPPTSIVYKLTVKDGKDCASLNAALVHVNVTPPGKVFAGNDTVVVIGQPLQLHATDVNHSGFTQYQWSPADGLNDPSSQNPVVNFSGNITFTVDAFTPAGCKGEGSVHVKIYSTADIFVPNAFTPNGDGHNDLLKAIPAGIGHLQYFAVYNRRGQQIFLSTNPDKGWDGTINGKPQSAGVYVWAALGTDYKGNTIRRSGTVVLVR